jgi:N-acetylglucosaminyl-diphospho-decaprenol L-rhamnosyltransferase
MHIVVAIVGFRNPDDIVGCLACLAESTYRDFEVVICENGGVDAHARLKDAILSGPTGGQVVTAFAAEANLGFAGGVNACIARAPHADAWWILNPDTCPEPGALAALVEKLSDGTCDAVGGVLRLPDGTNQAFGGLWDPWTARTVSIGRGTPWSAPVDQAEIERRQNFLLGASVLVGQRFLKVAGLMREDYFLYCEEIEWCARATALGLRLGFTPNAIVVHQGGSTTGSSGWSRLAVYLGERNKVLLTRDSFPQCLLVAVIAAAVIHVIRCAKRRAWRQVLYGLGGLIDGLRNRRGPPAWLVT